VYTIFRGRSFSTKEDTMAAIPTPVWAYLVSGTLFLINLFAAEWFYGLLLDSLERESKVVRVIGDLVSLSDAVVKSWGLYPVYPVFIFFGELLKLPVAPFYLSVPVLFLARYWIYYLALKSLRTKSRLDNLFFIGDILLRTVGIWQGVNILLS